MDAKKIFGDVSKIPIIGELIIATAIYFVMLVTAATSGYFGLAEEQKVLLPKIFLGIASAYFVGSLCYRIYKFLINKSSN